MIRGVGVFLVLTAALAAAYTPKDGLFGIVSGAHLLEQTIYLIEVGLLVFIFVLSAYFHLSLSRPLIGIALGLSISACVHLATWAIMANGGVLNVTLLAPVDLAALGATLTVQISDNVGQITTVVRHFSPSFAPILHIFTPLIRR